jgi:hypothetical protein
MPAFIAAHRGELKAAWPEGFAVAAASLGDGSGQSMAFADSPLIWSATADTAAAASEAAASRPDNRVVAFDHAPVGTAGTLVAHVIANVNAYDWGDDPPELRLPKPGERVVLGSGTLFTEMYGDAPVVGVRPDDGRADNWMDRNAISRCRNHLVRLAFEMPRDSVPGPAAARRVQAARQEGDLSRSAGLAGQVDFPEVHPLAPPGQAANEPARRPRAATMIAAAKAPQRRGR